MGFLCATDIARGLWSSCRSAAGWVCLDGKLMLRQFACSGGDVGAALARVDLCCLEHLAVECSDGWATDTLPALRKLDLNFFAPRNAGADLALPLIGSLQSMRLRFR